jgi:CheY-like chemotaxis protein
MRVLVVDDNREVAELLGELIGELGHTAKVCHRGDAVLDLVATFAPDVVLIDLGLPDVDGYEVSRQLGALAMPPAIVAISGSRPDQRKAETAGFAACLLKPIDVGTLVGALDGVAARAS